MPCAPPVIASPHSADGDLRLKGRGNPASLAEGQGGGCCSPLPASSVTTLKAVLRLPFFLVLLYFLVSLKKMPVEDALAHVQPRTRQGDTLKPRAAAGRGERVTLPRAQRPRFAQQRRQLRPRPARPRCRRACGSVAWTLRSEGRLQVSPHRPRGHASSVFRRHPRHLPRHKTFEDFRLETAGGGGRVASCRGT